MEDATGKWFRTETARWRERYARFGAQPYKDHVLNMEHGFRWLPERRFFAALGFGAADGQELLPVAHRLDRITIIDPVADLAPQSIHGVRVVREVPNEEGAIAAEDGHFDLITCFGALASIGNVEFVMTELVRCLAWSGWLLLREPITGVNLYPDDKVIARRYGLPLGSLRELIAATGLVVRRETLFGFPGVTRLLADAYNRTAIVRADAVACRAFAWNVHYETSRWWHKLRPRSVFFVLEKR